MQISHLQELNRLHTVCQQNCDLQNACKVETVCREPQHSQVRHSFRWSNHFLFVCLFVFPFNFYSVVLSLLSPHLLFIFFFFQLNVFIFIFIFLANAHLCVQEGTTQTSLNINAQIKLDYYCLAFYVPCGKNRGQPTDQRHINCDAWSCSPEWEAALPAHHFEVSTSGQPAIASSIYCSWQTVSQLIFWQSELKVTRQ